jgi:hypothetical protein
MCMGRLKSDVLCVAPLLQSEMSCSYCLCCLRLAGTHTPALSGSPGQTPAGCCGTGQGPHGRLARSRHSALCHSALNPAKQEHVRSESTHD